jgi:hypothetical protein
MRATRSALLVQKRTSPFSSKAAFFSCKLISTDCFSRNHVLLSLLRIANWLHSLAPSLRHLEPERLKDVVKVRRWQLMIRLCEIDSSRDRLIAMLRKAVQSANLNFIIGAGCSYPAISILGNTESEIKELVDAGESSAAEELIFEFLRPFLEVCSKMRSGPDSAITQTLENYKSFLSTVSGILLTNANNIMRKQANVFSTNYDLFPENAFEDIRTSIKFNDGFSRSPSLYRSFSFSMSEFFNSIYSNGNSYNYRVQIPCLNLIKLHGSMSWERLGDEITFSIDRLEDLLNEHRMISTIPFLEGLETFNRQFSIVFPRQDKFRDVVLDHTYYALLRLYANELDKENTLLIAEGFSFSDTHILGLTTEALRNPTLKLVIFCYEKTEVESYVEKFAAFNNVEVAYSETDTIDFAKFNSIIVDAFPTQNEVD